MVLLGRASPKASGQPDHASVAWPSSATSIEGANGADRVLRHDGVYLWPAVAPLIGSLIHRRVRRGVQSSPHFHSYFSGYPSAGCLRPAETLQIQATPLSLFAPFRTRRHRSMSHRAVAAQLATQTLIYGNVFGCNRPSVQPIFGHYLQAGPKAFPYWFGRFAFNCAKFKLSLTRHRRPVLGHASPDSEPRSGAVSYIRLRTLGDDSPCPSELMRNSSSTTWDCLPFQVC